ncbi:MAG: hypothetical protein ACLVH8_04410 [Fusobacterium sp.]
MNKKEKSESVFIFLREAENKKMIGTETGEAKANLDTFLEKLIADAIKEEDTKKALALSNLSDLINKLQNITKEEYFNFGVFQGQLLEDYSE